MTGSLWDWHDANGFTRLINVSGTMTGLGASVTGPAAQKATAEAMGHFVKMHELQEHAGRVISRLTGAEAGCVTASASAGISLCVAGCMTGLDPSRAEALPADPGPRDTVVTQAGHLCHYGAPVETAVGLTGGKLRVIGQSTQCADHQLEGALDDSVAAALYVVSHHVVHYGQIPFARFAEIAHRAGVPVIVDAASEYDLTGFIEQGADLAIYSGHKFLSGPTSGIIAGRRDLVRAAYLQNIGIGRGMKVGKESIMGLVAAMEAWMSRDAAAIRAAERAALDEWQAAVADLPGITARIVPDPTGNPLDRLQIDVDPQEAGANAAVFAAAFGQQNPAIIVRDHEVELGYFQLDPCNLLPGQQSLVTDALRRVLGAGSEGMDQAEADPRNGAIRGYLEWGLG
ncbi:aminotransferase class V-fold PLP-dependent enzyme [Paracoccus methylarcula]|uniref:Aminotransferase class V-fold PLP-dependent enzyme n=1 Tax=Paracoccus methylarcula TaxID=72022 RepID=A0A3R7LKA8_9RHOB|nr:aminotransferase class V-fold PLP-dependent enzyme [Paracoccus methylarcula]RNF34729.1 aminotransferase class V-fold PLP-dependent enzyme [Paracoccus methylarcula]